MSLFLSTHLIPIAWISWVSEPDPRLRFWRIGSVLLLWLKPNPCPEEHLLRLMLLEYELLVLLILEPCPYLQIPERLSLNLQIFQLALTCRSQAYH